MRKLFTLIFAVFFTSGSFAQAPQKMSYQAVIRDVNGNLVKSLPVGMRISILQGSATGTEVYKEIFSPNPQTNVNGLVTIEIGGGTSVVGTFAGIDWSTGTFFIKTEADPTGGTSYSISGTSQILSVPYALYANSLVINFKSRASDLIVRDEGSVWVIPKISVEKPYSLVPSVTDIEGNVYVTVKIGTQIWMAENLRTITFSDNAPIPLVIGNEVWTSLTTPAYCWHDNDISNKAVYGALYNWYTVNTGKLCPIGWHVPDNSEFEILTSYLGTLAQDRLREAGTVHWQERNENALNDSKFSALPGGNKTFGFSGFSGDINQSCFMWSSTEADALYLTTGDLEVSSEMKSTGCSVRCIKD